MGTSQSSQSEPNTPIAPQDHRPGFFPGTAKPMKLCAICQKLNDAMLSRAADERYGYIKHQPNYDALFSSASAGCQLCALFQETIVKVRSEEEQCSIGEAHQAFKIRSSHPDSACLISSTTSGKDRLEHIHFGVPYTYDPVTLLTRLFKSTCKATFQLRAFPGYSSFLILCQGLVSY